MPLRYAVPPPPAVWVLPALAVAVGFAADPARAGSLSGIATYRERIALPADAIFEAEIRDVSRADAPAPVLGRTRLAPAGQPPFRFTISYRDQDRDPRARYALRATVRHRGRLLFTTDRVVPVLDGRGAPVSVVMVQVASSAHLPLRGTRWQLVSLAGRPVTPVRPPQRPAALQFAVDQDRVSGSGGCNLLVGGFTLAGEQLRFGTLAASLMACPDATMAAEREFLEALATVRSWRISGERLELLDEAGTVRLGFRGGVDAALPPAGSR